MILTGQAFHEYQMDIRAVIYALRGRFPDLQISYQILGPDKKFKPEYDHDEFGGIHSIKMKSVDRDIVVKPRALMQGLDTDHEEWRDIFFRDCVTAWMNGRPKNSIMKRIRGGYISDEALAELFLARVDGKWLAKDGNRYISKDVAIKANLDWLNDED